MNPHYLIDIDISEDTKALEAQLLLQEIWDNSYGQDSSGQLLKGQWHPFRTDTVAALKAIELLDKSLSSSTYAPTSIEHAYILKLQAYAYHFSHHGHSYQKDMPQAYHKAQEYIQKALKLSQAYTQLQAKWYVEAAMLAAPKIYFGYKAPHVVQADLIVENHLRQAAKAYQMLQNTKEELRVWQLFDWYNASEDFRYQEYYEHLVELSTQEYDVDDLAIALTISQWTKYTIGPYKRDSLNSQELKTVLAYAQKALVSFQEQDLEDDHVIWATSLMHDLAYHYKHTNQDLKAAFPYSQQAIKLCKVHNKSFGGYSKNLAATLMELGQWDKALEVYQDALNNSTKLAYIDKEHFNFGIGIILYHQEGEQAALDYWKANLRDQNIMNGVASYSWHYVDEGFKRQLKKDALRLAKKIDYTHLATIINRDWPVE
ncbi:MAG: hypothetical protein GY810_19355 [Aureispira sp.]|nr:hypothetical protein [Aureispira sp.]